MNIFTVILFLTFLSFVYGERYLSCKKHTYDVDRISYSESVILIPPANRTDENIINKNCYWRIGNGSFRIIFEEFNLFDSVNCNLESLKIQFPDNDQNKSMTFCGSSYPKELQLHYTNYFSIVYSWGSPSKTPFRIILRKSNQQTLEIPQLNVSRTPMYIYSPGYPGKYYKNLDMEWILTANDHGKRIILEILTLNIEHHKQCQNDFIQVKGDHTDFLICGRQSKHVVALNDSRVNIKFKTNSFEENDGFVFRYYTEPYPENRQSCVKEGLTLTALPFKTTQFAVQKKPIDKFCTWIIKATTSKHVIVFEVKSYSMLNNSVNKCGLMLIVRDTPAIDSLITKPFSTDFTGDCSDAFLRYYRSKNSAITVYLLGFLVVKDMVLSFYSVPVGQYNVDGVLPIVHRPSYIFVKMSDVRSVKNSILLKAESGCISISWNPNFNTIEEYLTIYDGNSSQTKSLTKGNPSHITGSKQFMLLKLIPRQYYYFLIRKESYLLKMKSTDQCASNVKKLVIRQHQSFITIQSPNNISSDEVYEYEVSASRNDSVLYIRGVVSVSDTSCYSRVEFYSHNETFYKWCLLRHISKRTTFSKIRFAFYFDRKYSKARFKLTVIEYQGCNHPSSNNCSDTIYPAKGESKNLSIKKNPCNFDCSWLFIAPTNYEIQLTIQDIEIDSSKCISSLELYNGRDYELDREILYYCDESRNGIGKIYISSGGVLLLHVLSYAIDLIGDVFINYSVASSELIVLKKQQTYVFYRPSEERTKIYRFTKEKIFPECRIVLKIKCEPHNSRSESGFITFNNVIADGKYYKTYYVNDTSTTLYGAHDPITMNIAETKTLSIEVENILKEIGECGSIANLYATDNYQTVATPNMPGQNGTHCSWKIYTGAGYSVLLEISYSDLGTGAYTDVFNIVEDDVVSVIFLHGNGLRSFKSKSNDLAVTFQSNSSLSESGGALIRYVRKALSSSPEKDVGTSGTLIGILIAAGVIVVICLIIACFVCKRRKANYQRTRRTPPQTNSNSSYNSIFVINATTNNVLSRPPPSYRQVISSRTVENSSHGPSSTSIPSYNANSGQFEIQNSLANNRDHGSIQRPPPESPPPYDELPSYETLQQIGIPNRSVDTQDFELNQLPSPELPPPYDELPSYETLRQIELDNRSVDTVDHGLNERSSPELPPPYDGLPSYETLRQIAVPNRSIDTGDHGLNQLPSPK